MKAISLWQPWASAIAVGAKHIETRSWATSYRGPLAIHAAATRRGIDVAVGEPPEACGHQMLWERLLKIDPEVGFGEWCEGLPFGAIVAVANLYGCEPTDKLSVSGREVFLGDFSLGRFGWLLHDVQRLAKPIPWRGRQRLFDVPDDVIAAKVEIRFVARRSPDGRPARMPKGATP